MECVWGYSLVLQATPEKQIASPPAKAGKPNEFPGWNKEPGQGWGGRSPGYHRGEKACGLTWEAIQQVQEPGGIISHKASRIGYLGP
ncbi:hypothetical protein DSO57_1003664 [Entomophthora muscae]|uniref:Uncharacterized protein n=1 Tax=Entomophthora muscae TaxID=34485 RepID=A0ACC2T938_9FUNG|nr:hypothetical protein DSO57_1003664 [Entomophthora muscae]